MKKVEKEGRKSPLKKIESTKNLRMYVTGKEVGFPFR